jgi:hypothetical protein
MRNASFESFGGLSSILAGSAGFLYAVSFLVVARTAPEAGRLWSALFLMLGGLLATAALVALYGRLRATNEPAALWALLLGIAGVMGAAIHGGYDLAAAVHPVQAGASTDAPSQIDPRGLLTFGVTGVALVVIGRLISSGGTLPRSLGSLASLQGALLILLYLGRLIILTPTHPMIVFLALLSGFITGPAWYVWLGLVLRRS